MTIRDGSNSELKPERLKQASVRWADGSYDHKRVCDECGLANCTDPVYNDFYKEIVTKQSYWSWIESNMPFEGGTEEYTEPLQANPDKLEGKNETFE